MDNRHLQPDDRLRADIIPLLSRDELELLKWVARRHGWEIVNRDWESIVAAAHYDGMISVE